MSLIKESLRGYEEATKHAHVNTGNVEFLKCMVFNAPSVNNKCTDIMEHVIDFDNDVMFISETWLKSKNNNITSTFEDYGYKLHHNIRRDRRKEIGGGVDILVKSTLNVKPIKVKQFQSFEHCVVKLHMRDGWGTLISIYRLDYEPVELLETVAATNDKFIIAGDINIHCDNINDRLTVKLNNLLLMFNLVQVIQSPTHRRGHTLDVVITCADEGISQVQVSGISLSDHFLVSFLINCKPRRTFYETHTYRNVQRIDQEIFKNDIQEVMQGSYTYLNFHFLTFPDFFQQKGIIFPDQIKKLYTIFPDPCCMLQTQTIFPYTNCSKSSKQCLKNLDEIKQ